ncbi:MAG: PAS domain S-box protein, partial [Terriglobia bacterium]
RILTWNSSAERIYGFTSDEVAGKSMQILVPHELREEETGILERLPRGEQVIAFETGRVRKDGSRIPVSLTISPIRNREGQIIGASHIARDITDLRNLSERMQQAQKLESLGVLAGGIAHDFNNLLVGILGNASLVLDTMHGENRGLLHEIVRAGERAAELTSQLLAYAGKGRFYVQPIDISGLVDEISRLIRTSISPFVTLHLDLAEHLPPIEGDSGQIHQLVMNLVINAAEAIADGCPGEVFVRTGLMDADEHRLALGHRGERLQAGRYIVLEVRDTGCGMDGPTQSRIFDPFFTTKFTGRGLGLSAVLGIVGTHKGLLQVESAPGVGTTFRIFLPAAPVQAAPPTRAHTSRNRAGEGIVLVVDDEEIVRSAARNALERLGYSVLEASDGQEAVSVFADRHGEIGAIVLDLKMPNMGGEEALLRVREIREDIPVILSSGVSEAEALRRFEGQRIAGFVQKPYTPAQLGEKVKAARGSAGAPMRT